MAKKKAPKKANNNTIAAKTTIKELQDSRDGGQIALRGFTYQLLYSCYLILSELDIKTVFDLEVIEDIDQIKCDGMSRNITHIQLKYSTQTQDASFLKSVLKNFLETYLIDNKRSFKLIYDFPVAKGYMSKLFARDLDSSTASHWEGIVEQIKSENPLWNWVNFSFDNFISSLSFERKEKDALVNEIETELIRAYDITTDNIAIFANGIKVCCLEKMQQRVGIDKTELDKRIELIKDDISKGYQNPAHSWIKKLDFSPSSGTLDLSYFEGKKATPQDITSQLPIRRPQLEHEVIKTIRESRVTVIKASSGQGKTTLALQVSLALQSEYTIYQLSWCDDPKELEHIVQYFKTRVRLGEKPLVLIDNLDSQLREWNRLAQLLQQEVPHRHNLLPGAEDESYHYKLLLTTREDDWYSYGGDLSKIKALQIVKLALTEEEASEIFEVLRKAQKLDSSVLDWRKAWAKVADKKLLIEYVYLLTHGEMLSERVTHQISQIGKSDTGRIKCEILRKVCFADICGIKLRAKRLVASLSESTTSDYGEIIKSIENEFLIRINSEAIYVEGLHPVRSQHIVDRLHEFYEIDDTALQIVSISDTAYLSKLFSYLPRFISCKRSFYPQIVNALWDYNDLSSYVLSLRGVFSGSVMRYFHENRNAFDDANAHGGLLLVASELNPFARFEEWDYSVTIFDEIKKLSPDALYYQYLCNLRDAMPKFILAGTDIYNLCESLFNKLNGIVAFEITRDITSYSDIAYWLYNVNPAFNLSPNIPLQRLWDEKKRYSLDVLSSIMYTCFCGNNDEYSRFVETNILDILMYLREATQSLQVYTSEDQKAIHVEYILLLSDIKNANEESVSRLKSICKMLPIYEQYCADAIKPSIEMLSVYKMHDDAHKAIPIKNIVIMFHQEFAALWNKTLMSNYECDTVAEWLECWFSVRGNIVSYFEKSTACLYRLLEGKQLGNLASDVDNLRNEIVKRLISEFRYPNEDRPFEEKAKISEEFVRIKRDYFQSVQNFCNQFYGFCMRDSDNTRLAIFNAQTAQASLQRMQEFFANVTNEQQTLQKQHAELCALEEQRLEQLLMACLYFREHEPSKYFDKYQIKTWHNADYAESIESGQRVLGSLLENCLVVFPEKFYREGALSFYPIIMYNFDATQSDILTRFLLNCIPFAETIFDFLVVLFANTKGKIMGQGLRISKICLSAMKKAIETDDATLVDELTPPFLIETTAQMLGCFECEYKITDPISTDYEGIDRVAELLWAYSKACELLSGEDDIEYRDYCKSEYMAEVLSALASFEQKVSSKDYEDLLSLCKNVLNGQTFCNADFNKFCDKIVNRYNENLN